MPTLKFYDVAKRKSFSTDKFTKETRITSGKSGRRKVTLAVAKRDGRKVYRITKNEAVGGRKNG